MIIVTWTMTPMEERFEFLEHTADVYIAAYGSSMEQAFENAASATFETMTELEKIEPKVVDTVEVKGQDEYALLYNWLEALLVKFDVSGYLYSRFHVSPIKKTTHGLKLKARIWGEAFNPEKHLSKVGIKAVTYHLMEITQDADGNVVVKFILDI